MKIKKKKRKKSALQMPKPRHINEGFLLMITLLDSIESHRNELARKISTQNCRKMKLAPRNNETKRENHAI